MFLDICLENVNPADVEALEILLKTVTDRNLIGEMIGANRLLTALRQGLADSGDQIVSALIPGYESSREDSFQGQRIGLGLGLGPNRPSGGPGGPGGAEREDHRIISGNFTKAEKAWNAWGQPVSKGFI